SLARKAEGHADRPEPGVELHRRRLTVSRGAPEKREGRSADAAEDPPLGPVEVLAADLPAVRRRVAPRFRSVRPHRATAPPRAGPEGDAQGSERADAHLRGQDRDHPRPRARGNPVGAYGAPDRG